MAENTKQTTESIDYSKPQAEIDKAKAKAHDADKQRLAEESGLTDKS